MKKHRGMIAALLLCVIGVAAAFAGLEIYSAYSLPDPATADLQGLMKWLVLRDLKNEQEQTQITLVNRFEEIIQEPIDLDNTESLDESYLTQLKANAEFLREKWFFSKVNRYHQLPPAERKDYLDRQIHTIERWYKIEDKFQKYFPTHSSTATLPSLYSMIPIWIQQADAKVSQQIEEVVYDGLIRWLSTSDMSQQTVETRLDLVHTLEKNMADDVDFTSITAGLSTTEKKRYWHNVDILAAESFYERSRQYHGLSSEKRSAFLDEQIEKVMKMSVVDQLSQQNASDSKDGLSVIADRWVQRAESTQQPELRQFLNALKAATLKRKLFGGFKKIFPFGGN